MGSRNRDKYYYSSTNTNQPQHWATVLFMPFQNRQWNGHHQRLQPHSPTISACTTATDLSSLGDLQSSTTINRRMSTLEENLRNTIPEIEPLHKKEKECVIVPRGIDDGEDEAPNSFKTIKTQILAAVAVSWVSMIIGYSSAYTSPASISLERDLNITPNEMSWISGLMPLGALAGGMMGGTCIDHFGRKYTILTSNVLFLIAWTINYFAQSYWFMYVSRFIGGLSVGIASLTLPVYLAETLLPGVRGSLGLLPTALGNIGILVCYMLGQVYEWQGLALVGVILSIPFMLLFIWIIPETPRYYISKGNSESSRNALQWLRGTDADINKEFIELQKNHEESQNANGSVKDLISRTNIKLLCIVLGLMFFQQMSGINAVIFYTTKIFKESGSTLDEKICTTIVGIVNFVSTFIAASLIDRLGRKILLYVSSVSMILSLAILGVYFYLLNVVKYNVTPYGWLPLASFVVYVLGFSLGFGPIPWLMMGEIFPARIRGPAASIATGFNWTCTFIVTKTFLLIIEAIGMHGTFWLFGCIVCAALVFTIIFVPETKGKSLADIERILSSGNIRRISVENLKASPTNC